MVDVATRGLHKNLRLLIVVFLGLSVYVERDLGELALSSTGFIPSFI